MPAFIYTCKQLCLYSQTATRFVWSEGHIPIFTNMDCFKTVNKLLKKNSTSRNSTTDLCFIYVKMLYFKSVIEILAWLFLLLFFFCLFRLKVFFQNCSIYKVFVMSWLILKHLISLSSQITISLFFNIYAYV